LGIRARILLSQFADPAVRRTAGWWLLAACLSGFVLSMAVMAGLGYGLQRWVFILLVWTVLIFVPARILIESAATLGARARRALAARLAADPRRYERSAALPLILADLAERTVTLPRICRPRDGRAATAAAVGVVLGANATRGAQDVLRETIRRLVLVIGQEASALSASVTGAAADNVQARWEGARDLGAMAALASILAAVSADRWGTFPSVPELGGRGLEPYLAAAMDYCDEAALEVDALPWTEPPVPSNLPEETLREIRDAWHEFMAAGLPAPRALESFLVTIIPNIRS
jgi:hypothetical protein